MPNPTPHPAAGPPPILPDQSPSLPVPGDARLAEVCRRLGVSMLVLLEKKLRQLEGLVGAG